MPPDGLAPFDEAEPELAPFDEPDPRGDLAPFDDAEPDLAPFDEAVPRDELAEWLGGAADDFSNADWDWMGAQVSQLNMGGVSGKVVGNSKKKQKKKGW